MSRTAAVIGSAGVAMLLCCVAATLAEADVAFPTPGGAAGSQTGDGASVFLGVAESPGTRLFSGVATTSVEIVVPPGRGKATPKVRLVYSSSAGASPYGWGWSLPLARIRRSTKNGVPSYDQTDVFVLDTAGGSIELRPIAGTPRYRAKPESAFLRIGFDRSANRWIVVDKSGTRLVFGADSTSRSGPDPSREEGTYAWLIESSVDTLGNRIDYSYVGNRLGAHAGALPLRIDYGANVAASSPHLFSVRFVWSSRGYPAVPVASYEAGFAQPQDLALQAVETLAGDRVVRRYALSHEVDPLSGALRLVGVSLDGFALDHADDVALPSTVFRYAPAVQGAWPLGTVAEREAVAEVFESPGPFREVGRWVRFDTFDIDGDAIADYVDATANPPAVRFGDGAGFASPQAWPWPDFPRFVRKIDDDGDLLVNVFDITGDGLPDLVDGRTSLCGTNTWCVYRNTGSGFERTATAWPAPNSRIRVAGSGGATVLADVIDMNGDGLPDRIDAQPYTASYPYWHVYLNTGSGFALTPSVIAAPERAIGRSATSASRSYLLSGLHDMNGDRLPDFVLADVDGLDRPLPSSVDHWDVYWNTGGAFATAPLAWTTLREGGFPLDNFINEHAGDTDHTETSIDLVDVTGDGLPDRVRYWTPGFLWWYGFDLPDCGPDECRMEGTAVPPECCYPVLVSVNTGTSFAEPIGWPAWHDYQLRSYSDAPSAGSREFDLFDVDGDGLIDLVEREAGVWRVFRHAASPFASGSPTPVAERARPNLLVAMLNGVGGETHLSYRPAASYRGNRLPFPYWVVAQRALVDGIGLVGAGTFRYTYRGGRYDATDREFRGFAAVLEEDALGRYTATHFHQDALRQGLVASTLTLGNSSCTPVDPFDESDPCSPYRHVLLASVNQWPEQEPLLLVERSSTPYRAGSPVPSLSRTLSYEYDLYGNVVRETVASPSADTVTTETRYAVSLADDPRGLPDRYLVDLPLLSSTRAASSGDEVLQETRYRYDANEPIRGTLREQRECVEWSVSACRRWSVTTYDYDSYGNVVRVRSPSRATARMTYDEFHLYASTTRSTGREVTEVERDIATGRILHMLRADGSFVASDYDGLARPLRSWGKGFDADHPQTVYHYRDGLPGQRPGSVRRDDYGAAPVVSFFDGMGRRLAIKTLVETAAGIQTVVDKVSLYGAVGQLVAQSGSFPAPEAALDTLRATVADAPALTEYLYDENGRLIELDLADGSRVLTDRSIPGAEVTVFPNLASGRYAGKATVRLSDGFGRTRQLLTCDGPPVSERPELCPAAPLETRTVRYDGLDRPLEWTTAAASGGISTTSVHYDGLGNRIGLTDSDRGSWTYEYSNAGALTGISDPRGTRVTMKYDKSGKLRRQRSKIFRARYSYHRRGPGLGKLRKVRSRGEGPSITSKSFTYDERGRVVSETIRIRANGPMRTATFGYGYDLADRRTTVRYPGEVEGAETVLTTEYSPYGRITSLSSEGPGGRRELLRATELDASGNVVRMDFGNGLSDRFEYEPAAELGRLRCSRLTATGESGGGCEKGASDLSSLRITERDAAGNVLAIADQLHPPGSTLDRSAWFSYDALGRLLQARYGTEEVADFAYDDSGNLTLVGGAAVIYDPTAAHRPLMAAGQGLVHDAAGNRVAKGDWSYRYDELGRLAEVRRGSTLAALDFYDEGRTRVARYDAAEGSLHYYFGGLVEIDGDTLVRHYYAGGRLIASERSPAPRKLSLAVGLGGRSAATVTSKDARAGALPLSRQSRSPVAFLLSVAAAAALLAATLLCPAGGRVALVTAVLFLAGSLPLTGGLSCRVVPQTAPAWAAANARVSTSGAVVFYHFDRLGSPQLLTDEHGGVVEQRLYGAYGARRAVLDGEGGPLSPPSTDLAFGGHLADAASGLIYFGGRYYDPELGLFLTPDPEAEFASPYLYGGGNPVNGFDADGEFFGALIGGLLFSLLTAATASAFISGLAAGFQGGDILKAVRGGFIAGLAGAGLGTLAGTLNVAYQMSSGAAQFVSAAEAAGKVVEVAARSSFTTVVTHAAVTAGASAGLGSDWQTALGIVSALGASYAYDNLIIKDSGLAADSSSRSMRDMVKGSRGSGVQQANTTVAHRSITEQAAAGTGWERVDQALVEANVAQDGTGGSFLSRLRSLGSNESHFGRLSDSIETIDGDVTQSLKSALTNYATDVSAPHAGSAYVAMVGRAAHLIQDHLTLGHMVPGTSLFASPLGAPIRLVIHQVFGGEIAFRQAQLRATRDLLGRYPPWVEI